MGEEEAKMEVDMVSVKLPDFWTSNPRAWFIQAEAQFRLRQITVDETKFFYVVQALDRSVASSCASILEGAPNANMYDYLKEALIQRFQLSEEERADYILDTRALGDRRPSELAEAILELNGREPVTFLLRRIFMRALPPHVRDVLSTSTTQDLRKLAREADRVATTTGRRTTASHDTAGAVHAATYADPEMNAINRPSRRLCFYHKKWGKQARQCRQPCDWTPEAPPRAFPGNATGGLRQ